jgi:hypothetical protein
MVKIRNNIIFQHPFMAITLPDCIGVQAIITLYSFILEINLFYTAIDYYRNKNSIFH